MAYLRLFSPEELERRYAEDKIALSPEDLQKRYGTALSRLESSDAHKATLAYHELRAPLFRDHLGRQYTPAGSGQPDVVYWRLPAGVTTRQRRMIRDGEMSMDEMAGLLRPGETITLEPILARRTKGDNPSSSSIEVQVIAIMEQKEASGLVRLDTALPQLEEMPDSKVAHRTTDRELERVERRERPSHRYHPYRSGGK